MPRPTAHPTSTAFCARSRPCLSSTACVEPPSVPAGQYLVALRFGTPLREQLFRLAAPYAESSKGLKTRTPGRRKSRSFPVTTVSPWRRAVAAM